MIKVIPGPSAPHYRKCFEAMKIRFSNTLRSLRWELHQKPWKSPENVLRQGLWSISIRARLAVRAVQGFPGVFTTFEATRTSR
jgi:hypothetical protein